MTTLQASPLSEGPGTSPLRTARSALSVGLATARSPPKCDELHDAYEEVGEVNLAELPAATATVH